MYGEGLRRNRCGVWYWRWVVPSVVRPVFAAREISRSLGTASKREAGALALRLRVVVQTALGTARAGHLMDPERLKAHLARATALTKLKKTEVAHRAELVHAVAAAAAEATKHGVAAPPLPTSPKLSEAFEDFSHEMRARVSWTRKTEERERYTSGLLVACLCPSWRYSSTGGASAALRHRQGANRVLQGMQFARIPRV